MVDALPNIHTGIPELSEHSMVLAEAVLQARGGMLTTSGDGDQVVP